MNTRDMICSVSLLIYLFPTQPSNANAFDDKAKIVDAFAAYAFPLDDVSTTGSASFGDGHFTKSYDVGEDSYGVIMVERFDGKDVITDVIRFTGNAYNVVFSDLRLLEADITPPLSRCVACEMWAPFGVNVTNPSPLSPYVLFDVRIPSQGGFSISLDYDLNLRDFEDIGMRMLPGETEVCFFYKAPLWAQEIVESCITPPYATPVKISSIGDKGEISVAIYLPKRKVTTDWSDGLSVDARLFFYNPDNLQAFERVGFQLGDR